MNKGEFKDKVYQELVRITKSLANPHRLEIIEPLAQGEFSEEQKADQTHLSIPNKITMLDVRLESEMKQGHIADAISFPTYELSKRFLSKRHETIPYCRGPFCAYANEAVTLVTKVGYKTSRLEEGFSDWKLQDLPIEVTMNQ